MNKEVSEAANHWATGKAAMSQRIGTTSIVCLVCVATLLGHLGIASYYDSRIKRFFENERENELVEFIPERDSSSSANSHPRRLSHDQLIVSHFETIEKGLSDQPADALHPQEASDGADPRRETIKPLAKSGTSQKSIEKVDVWDVIEQEMPEASAEEREIWYEELKTLPAEAVRDMLKVRRQLQEAASDHDLAKPNALSPLQKTPPTEHGKLFAETIGQMRPVASSDWPASRQVLEQAIAWSTHNLVNAETPGYKRVEVVMSDHYAFPEHQLAAPIQMPIAGRGVQLKELRIDTQPGLLKATNRPLDLAIEGEGFFVLHDPEWGFLYTRCGAFTINSQGQLCLSHSEERWLEPATILPKNAVGVQITSQGEIRYDNRSQENEPREHIPAGDLKVARFPDPTRLIPLGRGLYRAPAEIEPLLSTPGTQGTGTIRAGFLEQSNVDIEREQVLRERWESLIRVLPSDPLPRTAHDDRRSPH